MNKSILVGRIIATPELKYLQSGTAATRFTVAVDRGLSKDKKAEAQAQNKPTADFIQCQCFGKTAELIAQYFEKGSPILIEGRIQTGSYDKDGKKVYTTDVMVEKFEFVGGKSESKPKEESYNTSDFMAIDESDDDSIPF